ncbi:activator of basal transcription 1 [Anabrus simplex]|uniref:activator of basal transcription 1 n=1 Tax=Anabrus simplex TaxID=316456 RepID=UPI0035A28B38
MIDNTEPAISSRQDQLKKRKRGIIYISTIPPYMTVTKITEIFSQYGEVGRVFLQPAESEKTNSKKKKKKPAKHFTEAWIEFKSKRVAKQVAVSLNNTRIESRKKSKFYDHIWSLKYLPRFKWIHLSERLAYERAVHKQRLRAEIAQAKREANYFSLNVDRSEKLRKSQNQADGDVQNKVLLQYPQRETEGEILSKKKRADHLNRQDEPQDRSIFLRNLFAK